MSEKQMFFSFSLKKFKFQSDNLLDMDPKKLNCLDPTISGSTTMPLSEKTCNVPAILIIQYTVVIQYDA